MSYFEKFLTTNQAYAALHGTAHLPLKPKTQVAIVTVWTPGSTWRQPWVWP